VFLDRVKNHLDGHTNLKIGNRYSQETSRRLSLSSTIFPGITMPVRRTYSVVLLLCLATFFLKPLCAQNNVQITDKQAQRFVTDLMSRMTLQEKIGQMEQAAGQYTKPEKAEELARKGEVGSFLFITDPVRINELQHSAVTGSRLHIPLLFGYDVIHGFHTIYPVPLALASSWDPALESQVQTMAAREASAAGVNWAFSPMVDIARDARWGRIMEGAGEDPYLGEQMAAAQIHGLQGEYIGSPDHILACVKHFAGYGAAVGGRDYDSSDISDDLLHNVYLRPYRAAVRAGAATVMSAYMDLNSVPATGNVWLMRDVLRKEWGFHGFVVSDWDAIKSLETHGLAANQEDAAVRALQAGINMEMTSTAYRDNLETAVKDGKVTVAMIDEMVRPILEMKYRLGLFSHPYVDVSRYERETGSTAQKEAALHAAEETPVLLRNEHHLLPLSKTLHSIAVIGPLAESGLDTNGSWAIHGDRAQTVTIAQGLREKLPQALISVTKGVEINRDQPSIFDGQTHPPRPLLKTDEERAAEYQHAIDLARNAEITVMVLGEAQNMSGERASRATLTLPGKQEQLLEEIVAIGKPVVLVLLTGRPLDITWASTHVPAILNGWYPGSEGGSAIANLLFGEANPSGHLTVSWPRDAGQEPLFYNTNLTQIPNNSDTRYWDASSAPLYPFGYGLSYANFAISDLKLISDKVNERSPLRVTVQVKNTSSVPGKEVVQLYVHQRAGSASRPVLELKAFSKIALAAGETRNVNLSVATEDLSFWSPALRKQVLEPGTFDIWVGDSSTAVLHTTFEVNH
jgi:beta-glucosidase